MAPAWRRGRDADLNHAGPDGRLLTSERFEYAAPGEAQLIHTPHLQNRPWYGTGLEAWAGCRSEPCRPGREAADQRAFRVRGARRGAAHPYPAPAKPPLVWHRLGGVGGMPI